MRTTCQALAAALVCASAVSAQSPSKDADPALSLLPSRTRSLTTTAKEPDHKGEASTAAQRPPHEKPASLDEQLISFDDRMADLQWIDGRWQLWAGPLMLKDFGRNETEGRRALALIRALHLTQRGTIGSPRPIMEYWLADGRAPTGTFPGLRTMPVDLASLRVEQAQGYWFVRDNASTFFNFGAHEDEAELALAVIKRHEFTRLGVVRQGTPMMLVFLGSPTGITATNLHPRARPKGRIAIQQPADTSAPVEKIPSSTLRPSAFHSAAGIAGRTAADPPGGDAKALAIPFTRQLAPPGGRSPDLAALAERVPLDVRQLRLVNNRGNWSLLCGDYSIAAFGPDEQAARLAEMAFRTSRFTEQCLIGRPKPAFSYFLVNGQPPRQLPLGAHGVAFRPEDLSLRQINNVWAICDLSRPLIAFGDRADEAKETIKAIQQHGFDTFCQLGQGERPMTILAKTR